MGILEVEQHHPSSNGNSPGRDHDIRLINLSGAASGSAMLDTESKSSASTSPSSTSSSLGRKKWILSSKVEPSSIPSHYEGVYKAKAFDASFIEQEDDIGEGKDAPNAATGIVKKEEDDQDPNEWKVETKPVPFFKLVNRHLSRHQIMHELYMCICIFFSSGFQAHKIRSSCSSESWRPFVAAAQCL